MTDILADLRKYGLVTMPIPEKQSEAIVPPDEDDEGDDQDKDQEQGDDEDSSAQTNYQPEMIEVPAEIKDKMLELHRLAGEIFGMFSNDEANVVDKYKKIDIPSK